MTDEQFERLLAEIQGLRTDVTHIKEKMETVATYEDVMKVSDTLQTITAETASAVEDKAEAGYVTLKSLMDGMENRLVQRMDENTQTILDTLKPLNELMHALVQKDQQQDAAIDSLTQWRNKVQKKLDLGGK